MKKSLTKIFLVVAVLLGFTAGFFAFTLPVTTFQAKAAGVISANATAKEIASADALEQFIINYDEHDAGINVLLTADINMAGKTLTRAIGDETNPFAGVFDGQGYTISNLDFDFSATTATNKYFGLFAVTNGAVIKNVGIVGTTKVKAGSCTNVYIGNVVGKASQTTLQYIQSVAKISLQDDIFAHNVYLGGFVGSVYDSTISHFISRTSDFGEWTLNDKNNRTYNVGGAIGYVSNSRLTFGVVTNKFIITIGGDFKGALNLGGAVGNIVQEGSRIINFVVENLFDVVDPNLISYVTMGQVIGVISNPAPRSGNLTYIYYKPSSTAEIVGNLGSYSYTDVASKDHIVAVSASFTDQSSFTDRQWHTLTGNWDFEKIWYISASAIALQSFYGDFTISIGTELQSGNKIYSENGFGQDSSGRTKFSDTFRYGATASFSFKFKKMIDGDRTIDMKDYFSLSSVSYGTQKKQINSNEDGYYLADTTNFELTHDENDIYTFTIKNINLSVAKTFDINTTAKQFRINITSRLYSDNALVEDVIPGYVYYSVPNPVYQESLQIPVTFGAKQIEIESDTKDSKSSYSFGGWYLKNANGVDTLINNDLSTKKLKINFGHGLFSDSCDVYVRYNDDAYVVTFKMDEGVKQIDLYSGDAQVTESNTSIAISKKEANFKIEVYINAGFKFDAEWFVENICLFKSSGEGSDEVVEGFCVWSNKDDIDRDPNYFVFLLDMTKLSADSVKNAAINFSVSTTGAKAKNNVMIWYIVGGAGGAVVLIVLIVVIVVVKKRKGFGGGGGSSFNKSSYKGMYF